MAFALVAVSTTMVSCGDDDSVPTPGGNNTPQSVNLRFTSNQPTEVDVAAATEIMNYICNKIGPGSSYDTENVRFL